MIELRRLIMDSLSAQGFQVRGDGLILAAADTKEAIRRLHQVAVAHCIERAKPRLARHEPRLLEYIASGHEVVPSHICPYLVEVLPRTTEELLFRYASLHWSIPVSSGYGRRLRFLVMDRANGKLIGLIGLCDPVYALSPRDAWIGWTAEARRARLRYVMEAYVLGSVPPYSLLLGGKLVAMLVTSDEVRGAFQRKYGERKTQIHGVSTDGQLALITTTSALGRSSVYNRLRYGQRVLMHSVGYTSGWGEFHFGTDVYSLLRDYALKHCTPSAKHPSWGVGYRNRRELVRRVLSHLGLSGKMMRHGIHREVFLAPLARNAYRFLRGDDSTLFYYQQSVGDLMDYFRARWLLPRAERRPEYRNYDREAFRLWS